MSAARDLEWEFTGRTPTEEFVRVPTSAGPVSYRLLALIPFSSTRKRMSIVVRGPDGRVVVLTKGADNVIFERYVHTKDAPRRLARRSRAFGAGLAGDALGGKGVMRPRVYPRVKMMDLVVCWWWVCRAGSFLDCSREDLDQHLQVFAADGLRTLVLARKEVRPTQTWTLYLMALCCSRAACPPCRPGR